MEEVQQGRRRPTASLQPTTDLQVQLAYNNLDANDFRLFSTDAGFVALPRPGARKLQLTLSTKAGRSRPFVLQSVRLRTPSEHGIGALRYAGELQLVHRDGQGAAVSLAVLLEGLPDHKAVRYPDGCPELYKAISGERECWRAAVALGLAEVGDAKAKLRMFSGPYDSPGCFAKMREGNWSVMLDPQVSELGSGSGRTVELCEVDMTISDWLLELIQRSTPGDEPPECGSLSHIWNERCRDAVLPVGMLINSLPFLRYRGSRTRTRTSQAGQFSVRFPSDDELGLHFGHDGEDLQVLSVDPQGGAATWNGAHPEQRVQAGDRVVAVNGVNGTALELAAALWPRKELELTLSRRRVPQCEQPLEWLVAPRPLPAALQIVFNRSAALKPLPRAEETNDFSVLSEEPHWAHGADLAAVVLSRGNGITQLALEPKELLAASSPALVFAVVSVVVWGLLRWPGLYEPDLVARTSKACWPLVKVHAGACAGAWAAVPLLLASHGQEAGWQQLPWACSLYLSAAVLAQLLPEVWYLWAAGCARSRVSLPGALGLLAYDALAIVDVYLDLLFFCVAFSSGSNLCWGALVVFFAGHLGGQWLLGAALASTAADEALLHWQPRQLFLMHTVVLRQMLSMQREHEVRVQCAWVVLPLLKCVFEDLPFVLFQLAYLSLHDNGRWWVVFSVATSMAMAARDAHLTFAQAYNLKLSAEGIFRAVYAHLQRAGFGRDEARGRVRSASGRVAEDGEEQEYG